MNELTAEWVGKAEEDFTVAAVLLRRRKIPADIVCFHCQQAAEKYLKARLQEKRIRFGKTHDLRELLASAARSAPALSALLKEAKALSAYAVRYRYPGFFATPAQARRAVGMARRVRAAVLPLLKE
jgi:HEPN domain-containing protein